MNDIASFRPGQLQEGIGIPAGRRHVKHRPDVKAMRIGGLSQRLRDSHDDPMGPREVPGKMPRMLRHAPEMLRGELVGDDEDGHGKAAVA